MYGWEWHGLGMPMMWLIWIPIIIVFILLIMKLMTGGRYDKIEWGSWESPREILKRRYAKGEISTEEFEKRKRNLETN